jgi:hypothetical protein
MYIVIAGDPKGGFSFYGPVESLEEAMAAGELIDIMHCGGPWHMFELAESYERQEEDGSFTLFKVTEYVGDGDGPMYKSGGVYSGPAVVFEGELCEEWIFYGPFAGLEGARKFAADHNFGCATPLLKPFTAEHVRLAKEKAAAALKF